jgi:hypothetical protein
MAAVGNKRNSVLNGEFAAHVRKRTGQKRQTQKYSRQEAKREIKREQS